MDLRLFYFLFQCDDILVWTHFRPIFPFYNPWKHIFWGFRRAKLAWNGLNELTDKYFNEIFRLPDMQKVFKVNNKEN